MRTMNKRRTEHVIKMDDQNTYTSYVEHKPRKHAKDWFDAPPYGKHSVGSDKSGKTDKW